MYTINIRGKQNPKDQKIVKLGMIFFKTVMLAYQRY